MASFRLSPRIKPNGRRADLTPETNARRRQKQIVRMTVNRLMTNIHRHEQVSIRQDGDHAVQRPEQRLASESSRPSSSSIKMDGSGWQWSR